MNLLQKALMLKSLKRWPCFWCRRSNSGSSRALPSSAVSCLELSAAGFGRGASAEVTRSYDADVPGMLPAFDWRGSGGGGARSCHGWVPISAPRSAVQGVRRLPSSTERARELKESSDAIIGSGGPARCRLRSCPRSCDSADAQARASSASDQATRAPVAAEAPTDVAVTTAAEAATEVEPSLTLPSSASATARASAAASTSAGGRRLMR